MLDTRRYNYKNKAEEEFRAISKINNVICVRKGYPDFMLLDDNEEIIGFVEVKPKAEKLRAGQVRFEKFCKRYGIPFVKWIPGDPFPELEIVNN